MFWSRIITSLQNLLDFDVVGTEATVELEVVGVVKKRSTQREEELLREKKVKTEVKRDGIKLNKERNI